MFLNLRIFTLLVSTVACVVALPYQPEQRINFRRFVCPPLRTLPDINESRSPATLRMNRHFLEEWCPPGTPIVFPDQPLYNAITSRPLAPRPIRNPYRGLAVEGGSIPIVFPGQEHPLNSIEAHPNFEFVNSKMHPSLLPNRQRYRSQGSPWNRLENL
ncbi:uncharacterized protein LOC108673890 isoform X2 [Hyalella azteca]|uniref:Uncharacterized protein LOC108673890 isoform X2 n=1 Tax=Hyalella azteca TaxID=294128 RepID=A0A8B7NU60_HYAAZ|nr:uncharacterized protein LOC108673890 isoform X2 [Hyalella azteca]